MRLFYLRLLQQFLLCIKFNISRTVIDCENNVALFCTANGLTAQGMTIVYTYIVRVCSVFHVFKSLLRLYYP